MVELWRFWLSLMLFVIGITYLLISTNSIGLEVSAQLQAADNYKVINTAFLLLAIAGFLGMCISAIYYKRKGVM